MAYDARESMDAMTTCDNCGASLSPAIPWCGQCYRPLVPYRQTVAVRQARPTVVHPGPTTFGIVGRLLVTAMVVAVGIGLRAAAAGWSNAVGRAGGAIGFVLLGVWAIAAVPILWSTWRPGRRTRIVYVDGPLVSVTPVRPRADDPSRPAP
jgi:hypothetical protein